MKALTYLAPCQPPYLRRAENRMAKASGDGFCDRRPPHNVQEGYSHDR